MRVSAVYDEQGTILAAAVVTEGGDELVALEGEQSDVFDVSDEVAGDDLAGLLQQFSVDVGARALKKANPPAQD